MQDICDMTNEMAKYVKALSEAMDALRILNINGLLNSEWMAETDALLKAD